MENTNKNQYDDIKKLLENYKAKTNQEKEDKEFFLWCLDNFSDLLTRKNEQFHFTATAFITNKTHDKVLSVYHNIYDDWSLVGGHADGMKIMKNVVKKEVYEETGLKQFEFLNNEKPITIEKLLVDQHFKGNKLVYEHYHLNFTFLLEADETLPVVIKSDENSDIRWFKFDEFLENCLEENMLPHYKLMIKKIKLLK